MNKVFEWHFPQGDMQMAKCSTSFAIIEMQIKTLWKCQVTTWHLQEQQWWKRQTITSAEKEVESLESLCTVGRNVK